MNRKEVTTRFFILILFSVVLVCVFASCSNETRFPSDGSVVIRIKGNVVPEATVVAEISNSAIEIKTYQWKVGDDGVTFVDVPGATGKTLVLDGEFWDTLEGLAAEGLIGFEEEFFLQVEATDSKGNTIKSSPKKFGEIDTIEIASQSNGTVEVTGLLEVGNEVTVTAIPEDGYVFDTWEVRDVEYETVDFHTIFPTLSETDDTLTFTVNENHTVFLEASYKRKTLTVTLDYMGGSSDAPNTTEVTYWSSYTLPEVTKEGYVYDGWTVDGNEDRIIHDGAIVTTTTDHTLSVRWIKESTIIRAGSIEISADAKYYKNDGSEGTASDYALHFDGNSTLTLKGYDGGAIQIRVDDRNITINVSETNTIRGHVYRANHLALYYKDQKNKDNLIIQGTGVLHIDGGDIVAKEGNLIIEEVTINIKEGGLTSALGNIEFTGGHIEIDNNYFSSSILYTQREILIDGATIKIKERSSLAMTAGFTQLVAMRAVGGIKITENSTVVIDIELIGGNAYGLYMYAHDASSEGSDILIEEGAQVDIKAQGTRASHAIFYKNIGDGKLIVGGKNISPVPADAIYTYNMP